jgi:ATP-dependent Lhr-like helicase
MIAKRLGKALEILVEPDAVRFPDYCMLFKDMLNREFKPVHRISVETINGGPALRSPYAGALKELGFHAGKASLDLWREP